MVERLGDGAKRRIENLEILRRPFHLETPLAASPKAPRNNMTNSGKTRRSAHES
jgi:hypothetical protein